jgi:hypothetical protein
MAIVLVGSALVTSTTSGCVREGGRSPVVTLDPPRAVPVSPTATYPNCTIMGEGELFENPWEDAPALGLYESARAPEPALVVVKTTKVGIAWSELPIVAEAAGPAPSPFAAVALGDQHRIAVHAWAKLTGRRFQLRTTGDVIPDHMWIDRGVPVEVLGMRRGAVVVRRASGFEAPVWFQASVACGMMAYEPKAIDPPNDDDVQAPLSIVGAQLELHTRPAGDVFVTLRPGDGPLSFSLRDSSGDWVRVRWHERGLGLDGWVRRTELDEGDSGMIGLGNIGTTSGHGRASRTVVVQKPAKVLLGDDRHPFADAVFERGALLDVWSTEGDYDAVTLNDESITSSETMWIDRRAVADP